jgi:AcrR family transcriptional regulator
MARPKPDKTSLLNAMAVHVLEHGLNTASLRPLAKSAGTSDRMLIYHFGSKDALVAELLGHLAAQMAQGLDAALPDARFESVGSGVETVVTLMRQPAFAPYSRVWLDIVSAASHGARDHSAAGKHVIDGFLGWIEARLPDGLDAPAETARLVLTLIEGTLVMDAIGHADTTDRAVRALARLTDGSLS